MIKFREVVYIIERSGDYSRIEIYRDDVLVQEYGDQYHDKGREKAEGFFDGIIELLGGTDDGKWSYDYEEVADEEY